MTLEDLILFCAMGPPGGGRSVITARMVRHFNLLAYTELDESTIKFFFNFYIKLLDGFFLKLLQHFLNHFKNK